MLYIEFRVSGDDRVRDLSYESLRHELRKWASQHNVGADYMKPTYHSDRGCFRVDMPSDRAAELFCLSWAPTQAYWRDYKLRKSI